MAEYMEPIVGRVQGEQRQGHDTRKHLFTSIREKLGIPVMTYFTSMEHPVQIDDNDADIIEALLQKMALGNGIAIIISSKGGQGLAAERIIKALRSYSGTGKFTAIIPNKAKSAATMVCFGAEKIMMSPTSELGPVDPQWMTYDDDQIKVFSLFNLVKSYESLFNGAVKAKGNLQPYLQQLQRYDARQIAEFRDAIDLSKDISIRSLESGMMSGRTRKQIEKDISVFLTPQTTKTHGRPIYADEAQACKLEIDLMDVSSDLWKDIYELYVRSDVYTRAEAAKCVETEEFAFSQPVPRRES